MKEPSHVLPSPTQIIRRLPWSAGLAAAQLAGGPALLAGLEETHVPAMRWYCMSPSALLLGSAQRISDIDAAACSEAGLTVHRRRSGGGAVLGDENLLMLDVAIPRDHDLFLDDVTKSYHWIGDVWAAALRMLGLDAYAIPVGDARTDTQNLNPLLKPVCYGGLSPFETMVGKRKVVGLAQLRRRAGALFQCGVYLHWDPQRTAALMSVSMADRAALAEQLATRVGGLDALLGREVSSTEVMESFNASLERMVGLVPTDADWASVERTTRSAVIADYAAIEL